MNPKATYRAQLGALLEAAADPMVVVDRGGNIVSVNTECEKLFGYTRAELQGTSIDTLVPDRFRGRHGEHRAGFFAAPRARTMGSSFELSARRRDGSEIPVEISLSPLQTEYEAPLAIAAIRDVTIRREAYRRIEEAHRLKSEFLASVSHELRTPLNAIIGFTELLHDERLGPIQPVHREYLGEVLNSAHHLLALINDILDLAKIEAGRMDFRPVEVDLPALIGEVRDVMRLQLAERQATLAVDCDPALARIVADPGKLNQILFNFLSNALQHSPRRGRIWLRVRPEADECLRIEVEDQRPGIRAEDLPRLFAEFQQLGPGHERPQGTGLGLALTRRIVEAQGGTVGVASEAGRGAVFHAVLPRRMKAVP